MAQVSITVNGKRRSADVEPRMLLVYFLREQLNLTGTHVGCDTSQCGACTVLLDGRSAKSCTMFAVQADGSEVTTIEGLARERLHPIQQAWITEQVPQCGYCQAGMIMTAAALLNEKPSPSDKDIDRTMTNICRCGTYQRVRRAIHRASTMANQQDL